jgi:four helix bundle protein
MLEIDGVALTVAAELKPVVAEIAKSDPDLARQMRRAVTSVVLNIAEGMGSFGGHRKLRYQTALGSMRESVACVEVAQKLDYVGELDARTADRIQRVIATLINLVVVKR